jgi:glycosyltransferase involved in cell wall biosynthesis
VVVNTVHGLYALPEDRWAKRAAVYSLERLAASCSHAELLQNAEDLPTLQRLRVPRARLEVLGNGIDLHRFQPAAVSPNDRAVARKEMGAVGDEIVVGCVGRLVREKGYSEVFEAASLLADRAPEVRFAVIGPDEPTKADGLTTADRSLADAARVALLGERDDVAPFYAGMDIHLLASHREGFPRSPMEAAAMGIPVVTTDVRGCRQTVDHERTGLLVPVRSPQAIAEAVERLATDASLRRRMGAAARAKAEAEFDQQRCIDHTLSTYARLLRQADQPITADARVC